MWACPQYITLCCAKVEKLGLGLVSWLGLVVDIGRGATTFSKLGVQFLGLGYYTEQNTDGIPSFVHCSLQLRKKLGWSVQFFFLGGVRSIPPTPLPVVAPLDIGYLRYLLSLYSGLCRTPHRASVNSGKRKSKEVRSRFQAPHVYRTDSPHL